MTEPNVIEVTGLCRSFGAHNHVLTGVDLCVQRGSVLGLLGRNGAGKTTLIQLLLGILRFREGRIRVLDLDPSTSGPEIRARVGYVSEQPVFYANERVSDFLRFVSSFYSTWSTEEAERLGDWLKIPQGSRIRELSRGMRAKLALLVALAHQPRLLVLDEPSSGLDPIVREEFLEAVVDLVAQGGRTVLFSSHLLEDLERVADSVAILAAGQIRVSGKLEALRDRVKEVRLYLSEDGVPEELRSMPGVLQCRRVEGGVVLLVDAPNGALMSALEDRVRPQEIEVTRTNLNQLFRAYTADTEG
ncbi:ABC transporter ATP-binding protein [Planctomycetota bacterium]